MQKKEMPKCKTVESTVLIMEMIQTMVSPLRWQKEPPTILVTLVVESENTYFTTKAGYKQWEITEIAYFTWMSGRY